MAEKKKANTPASSRASISTETRIMLWALALFVIVRGVAGLIDTTGMRLWGVDFFSTIGSGYVQILLWLPLIFVLPSVAGFFVRKARTDKAVPSPSVRLLVAAAATAVAVLLAWQINVGYAFLGDGTWYPAELLRSMTLPDYANSMIKPSAWLTGLLLDGLARHFQPEDIRLPFVLTGIAGAVIATAAVFFFSRKERTLTVVLVAVMLLGATGSLVFLGYIELYAIVYALSIAYMVSAWEAFRGGLPVWIPGAFLFASVLFGASAVVWLPSFLLLLHWKVRGEEGAFPLRRAARLLMAAPFAGVFLLYMFTEAGSDSAYLVALTPYERIVDGISTGWQNYVFTAPERWMDFVNVLFLTLGGVLFMLPVLVFVIVRKRLLSDPSLLFALTAAAGGLTLLLFGNTFLGLARDWDVAALAVLGCLMFVLASIQILHTRGVLQLPILLPAIAVVVLSQLLLWVAVNTDEEASAARFAQIAEMDEGLILPMNSFTAWENLRKFHRSGGEQHAYFHAMRRLIATGYRRDVSYAEYLSALLQLRDPGERNREMTWLFSTLREDAAAVDATSRPGVSPRFFPEFSMRCLLSAWQTGETDLVARYLPVFDTMYFPWSEKGLLTLLQSEVSPDAARATLEAAVSDSTGDAFLLMTAGGLYQRYGFPESAARMYNTALRREPTTYPSWYLVAARLHLDQTGDAAKARRYLEDCIRNAPTSPEAGQARDLLARIP